MDEQIQNSVCFALEVLFSIYKQGKFVGIYHLFIIPPKSIKTTEFTVVSKGRAFHHTSNQVNML